MSKKVSRTLIGAFVLGAVALLVVSVAVFGGGKFFKQRLRFVSYFPGSVQGLSVGSPVKLRGVPIGSVTDVIVRLDPETQKIVIPVFFEIEPERLTDPEGRPHHLRPGQRRIYKDLIERGLRAQLESESFVTGMLQISLDFHPGTPANLVGKGETCPEVPTIPSTLEQLQTAIKEIPLKEIGDKLDTTIAGINKLVADIDRIVTDKETKKVTKSINDMLKDARELAENSDQRIAALAKKLDPILEEVEKLLKGVNAQVGPVSEELKGGLADARKLIADVDKQVEPLSKDVTQTLEETRTALQEATRALAAARGSIDKDSRLSYELSSALKEATAALRSVRLLAEYLQRHPESLVHGKSAQKGN